MIPFKDSSSSAIASTFPSKAHLILSRFRPIAPKPVCLSSSSSASCCFPSSSCTDLSSSTTSASIKSKRPARKRPRRGQIPPNSAISKRPKLDVGLSASSNGGSQISSHTGSITSGSTCAENTPITSEFSVAPPSAFLQKRAFDGALHKTSELLPFSNQLARNPDERNGFGDLIKLLAGRSPVAVSNPPVDPFARHCFRTPAGRSAIASVTPSAPTPARSFSCNGFQSAVDLVSSGNGSLDMAAHRRLKPLVSAAQSPTVHHRQSPALHKDSVCSTASVDRPYLEQVYGESAEPVLLVDDSNRSTLWFNKAYERALKSASERASTSAGGPYIDPLGHPTPLFIGPILDSQKLSSTATLWGFLKKLVTDETETVALGLSGDGHESEFSNELSLRLGKVSSVSAAGRGIKVILESISDFSMKDCESMACGAEEIEERLASVSIPVFITECRNRIRWTNAAFQKTVGRSPQCRKDVNYFHSQDEPEPALIVSSTEKVEDVPKSASAFSGRINLEWINGGRRHSMSVPCDVCRLVASSSNMPMSTKAAAAAETWLWKLDAAVSLSL